jgi:hypothetical protein
MEIREIVGSVCLGLQVEATRMAANMATAKATQAESQLLRAKGWESLPLVRVRRRCLLSTTDLLRRASPLARMPSLKRQIIDGALPIPTLHKFYRPVLVSCPDRACDFSQFPR